MGAHRVSAYVRPRITLWLGSHGQHTRPCTRPCAKPYQTSRVYWLMPHGQVTHPCVRPCGAYWLDFNFNTKGHTAVYLIVCHTRLRHTLVSLPMWTKVSHFCNNLNLGLVGIVVSEPQIRWEKIFSLYFYGLRFHKIISWKFHSTILTFGHSI